MSDFSWECPLADPIGAPTFAQMFSPSKSPFYATALAAIVCLFAISQAPLAKYGVGIALFVLSLSTYIAPLFRPKQTYRDYNVSLLFARAAGLIGSLVCLSVLIVGSGVPGTAAKLTTDSGVFESIWGIAAGQLLFMGILFVCKIRPETGDDKLPRYNIVQFTLIQSIILIAMPVFAVGHSDYPTYDFRGMLEIGIIVVLSAPFQAFGNFDIDVQRVLYALMFLWISNFVLNLFILWPRLRPGWVGDHGDESRT